MFRIEKSMADARRTLGVINLTLRTFTLKKMFTDCNLSIY